MRHCSTVGGHARRSYAEMIAIFLDGAKDNGSRRHVPVVHAERHLAIDKALHDPSHCGWRACIDQNDLAGLRRVIGPNPGYSVSDNCQKAASEALPPDK